MKGGIVSVGCFTDDGRLTLTDESTAKEHERWLITRASERNDQVLHLQLAEPELLYYWDTVLAFVNIYVIFILFFVSCFHISFSYSFIHFIVFVIVFMYSFYSFLF